MEMDYQKKLQGIQEETRRDPVEETWINLDQSLRNIGKKAMKRQHHQSY